MHFFSLTFELAKFYYVVLLRRVKTVLEFAKYKFNPTKMETNTRNRLWRSILTASSFTGLSYLFMFNNSFLSYISGWFHWCPTSLQLLEEAEKNIFKYVQKPYELLFVSIPASTEKSPKQVIRSLFMNKDNKENTPIVLLHGFASGIGLWILNLDSLSEDRPVYTFDLLGFGRSSRPNFSKDAEEAENQLIESIEEWRKQVNLEKFILLGHSMGGFLAASYAIKYPDNVKHLILADPWGFPEPTLSVRKIEIPLWAKILARILQPFNPLAGLRIAGPWGPQLIQKLRPDIIGKFEHFVEDPLDVTNYIYHCNAQCPSGESAFKSMTARFGWAKRPMINRISQLKNDIPITFIYGSRSWIDSSSGIQVKALRKTSYVDVKLIHGAGHHVYADQAEIFNKVIREVCREIDHLEQDFEATKHSERSSKGIIMQERCNSVNDDKPCAVPL